MKTLSIFLFGLVVSGSALSVPLITTLKGSEEVPGPGDEDGSGFAALSVAPLFGKICFLLSVDNIEPATAAHIHKGIAGETGGVVVPLTAPEEGNAHGCVKDLDKELLRDLIANPTDYYVNVHNDEFPAGALRGQLGLDL